MRSPEAACESFESRLGNHANEERDALTAIWGRYSALKHRELPALGYATSRRNRIASAVRSA
jgi:hypothetical protein